MGKLMDRVKELSPFIRLTSGESITGVYKSWREVPNRFDPEKTNFQYELEVGGKKKFWESGNSQIAFFFDGITKDTEVIITRTGEGRDTKYEVKEA